MKTPESLETLVDYGIIQEVIRPLMSGKEAHVYVVISGGVECVAKVYKEANQRTFKHRAEYTEGRRTRNTRDQRAINKRTRHGRKQDESAWRSAEVDTLYRVRDGGVRVPEPLNFVDGVLVMELVRDSDGDPAPRLGDVEFAPDEAVTVYQSLIREVVRMLCAGTIHGDLSEFNVLMAADGPVVIDFPQSVDPAKNQSARKLLLRDVENLHRFLARHAPDHTIHPLGEEMWALYEKNRLSPDTQLRGDYQAPVGKTNMDEVLALIDDANEDERKRRDARGDETPLVPPSTPLRRVVDFSAETKPRAKRARPDARNDAPNKRPRTKNRSAEPPAGPASTRRAEDGETTVKRRRNRRRRPARNPSPEPAPGAQERESRTISPDSTAPSGATKSDPSKTSAGTGDPSRARKRRRGRRRASPRPDESNPPATSGRRRPPSGPAATRDREPPANRPGGRNSDPSPKKKPGSKPRSRRRSRSTGDKPPR